MDTEIVIGETSWPANVSVRWRAPVAALLALSGVGLGVRYGMGSLAVRKVAYSVAGTLAVTVPPVLIGVDHLVQERRHVTDRLARYRVASPLGSDAFEWRDGVKRVVPQLVEGVEDDLLHAAEAGAGKSFRRDCLDAPREGTCAGQTLALHELAASGGHAIPSDELLEHLSWKRVAYFHSAHKLRCSLERLRLPGCREAVECVRSREELWFEGAVGSRHVDVHWPLTAAQLAQAVGRHVPEGGEPVVGHVFMFPADKARNAHLLWFQVRPVLRVYDSAQGCGLFEFPAENPDLLYHGLWAEIDRTHRQLFEVGRLFVSLVTVDE